MLKIVSMGGGVNSTAVLVGMRERGERPDAILFADTGDLNQQGGEKPETYAHVNRVALWCRMVGFPEVTIVRRGTPLHASLYEECLNNETLPSKAFGFGGCSDKWKRHPMDRWVKNWGPAKEAFARGEKVARLIGIHAGEPKRGKIPDTELFAFRFPLKEWGWAQEECEAACQRAFGYVPIKSACFYCPSSRKPEVLELAEKYPDLFQQCVEMEHNATEAGNLKTVKGLGRHWTWEELVKGNASGPEGQAPICDTCIDW